MKFTLLTAIAAVAIAMPMVAAEAATAVYTISGTGSGSLNGTAFSDASFTFTLSGDTTNLFSNNLDPLATATASIAGFADTTFLISTRLGVNGGNVAYFSRSSGADLFDFFLGGPVDLGVSFGPVTGTNVFALNQFQGVATSGGDLSFDSSSSVLFSGRVGGVGPGVPEAPTWAMLIAGFGLVGASLRRRAAVAA